jgi:hypothetical protein
VIGAVGRLIANGGVLVHMGISGLRWLRIVHRTMTMPDLESALSGDEKERGH